MAVRYLEKTTRKTYEPGSPYVPGDPGRPAVPARDAYCEIVEREVESTRSTFVPVDEMSGFLGRNPSVGSYSPVYGAVSDPLAPGGVTTELTGYLVTVNETVVISERVCYPAREEQPAIPPTPPQPPTPGQWVIDQRLGWNAGAYSQARLDGDVNTQFRVSPTGAVAVGFSRLALTEFHYRALPYALLFRDEGVSVYESGVRKLGPVEMVDGSYGLQRIAGAVYYRQGNELLYMSDVPSEGSLVVTVAMYAAGDRVI